jgi:hypothetical protein
MKGREDRNTRMMENSLNRLNSFFTKANYTTQVRGDFVARAMTETNDAIDYFDTVSKIGGFVLSRTQSSGAAFTDRSEAPC